MGILRGIFILNFIFISGVVISSEEISVEDLPEFAECKQRYNIDSFDKSCQNKCKELLYTGLRRAGCIISGIFAYQAAQKGNYKTAFALGCLSTACLSAQDVTVVNKEATSTLRNSLFRGFGLIAWRGACLTACLSGGLFTYYAAKRDHYGKIFVLGIFGIPLLSYLAVNMIAKQKKYRVDIYQARTIQSGLDKRQLILNSDLKLLYNAQLKTQDRDFIKNRYVSWLQCILHQSFIYKNSPLVPAYLYWLFYIRRKIVYILDKNDSKKQLANNLSSEDNIHTLIYNNNQDTNPLSTYPLWIHDELSKNALKISADQIEQINEKYYDFCELIRQYLLCNKKYLWPKTHAQYEMHWKNQDHWLNRLPLEMWVTVCRFLTPIDLCYPPEMPYKLKHIVQKLRQMRIDGFRRFVIPKNMVSLSQEDLRSLLKHCYFKQEYYDDDVDPTTLCSRTLLFDPSNYRKPIVLGGTLEHILTQLYVFTST